MRAPTLVILAAGMASRYGSQKQTEGFGPHGETIMDYSIYDAMRAGFGKVVFIIREDFSEAFKQTFEPKLKALVLKEITNNGANFKSTIINNGGRNITALGFCYSESNNPTINNNKINNLIVNIGDFYSGFFVLKPNTKYYIRSFAANSEGLAYSNVFAFTTMK